MKLFAILIGINKYPRRPLNHCVDDAEKMERYIKSVSSRFTEHKIIPLHNEKVTKDAIVHEMETILAKATDGLLVERVRVGGA